jgi:hypothetical protein
VGRRRGESNISHSRVIRSDVFNVCGCVQLEEYRASSMSGGSSPRPPVQTSGRASVLEQYGIATSDDEDDAPRTQSVAAEMAAYLDAPRAPKGTDTLLFWGVSPLTCRIY